MLKNKIITNTLSSRLRPALALMALLAGAAACGGYEGDELATGDEIEIGQSLEGACTDLGTADATLALGAAGTTVRAQGTASTACGRLVAQVNGTRFQRASAYATWASALPTTEAGCIQARVSATLYGYLRPLDGGVGAWATLGTKDATGTWIRSSPFGDHLPDHCSLSVGFSAAEFAGLSGQYTSLRVAATATQLVPFRNLVLPVAKLAEAGVSHLR